MRKAQFNAQRQSTLGSFRFLPDWHQSELQLIRRLAPRCRGNSICGAGLRRLTEAARAEYLASEEGRRAVIVSLISDVIDDIFPDAGARTGTGDQSQDQRYRCRQPALVQLRRQRGAASGSGCSPGRTIQFSATAQIEAVERGIAQSENLLSLLLGSRRPTSRADAKLDEIPVPPDVPAGLPSALLERRPDIRAAEQNLVAANARIGAARALYFPQLSLTAFAGGQSRALTEIATAPARVYSVAPSALLPIFHAGQIRNQVRLTEAQQREMVDRVSANNLHRSARSLRLACRLHTLPAMNGISRSNWFAPWTTRCVYPTLRYSGGLDSYLQVLDSQRNLFAGELTLARLRLQERLAVVQLYRALGGGWN